MRRRSRRLDMRRLLGNRTLERRLMRGRMLQIGRRTGVLDVRL